MKSLRLDKFALRQWEAGYSGTQMRSVDPDAFVSRVNELYLAGRAPLVDGYAPFCKHLFVANFVDGLVSPVVPITEDNEAHIRSEYRARRPTELPVLVRYLPKHKQDKPVPATYLDIILYSREQIQKENAATGETQHVSEDYDWAIISVKAQTCDYELPMEPITMMRNAIISEGGSGVDIDRDKYLASVEYWKKHVTLE